MIITKKYILLKSALVLALAFFIALILQVKFNPNETRRIILFVPFFAFLINYVAFLSAIGKNSLRNFSTQISALFGIKFFSYLIITLGFFVIEKENFQRLIFIFFVFLEYLLNTIVLLHEVLKYQKSISKSDDISK